MYPRQNAARLFFALWRSREAAIGGGNKSGMALGFGFPGNAGVTGKVPARGWGGCPARVTESTSAYYIFSFGHVGGVFWPACRSLISLSGPQPHRNASDRFCSFTAEKSEPKNESENRRNKMDRFSRRISTSGSPKTIKRLPAPVFLSSSSPIARSGFILMGSIGCFAPDAGESGLNFFFEAGDQFAVGGDQRLLSFNLGYDSSLRSEGWEGEFEVLL